MRRRLLVAASFASLLVACASVLGDFEVEPAGSNPDASSQGDGSSSSGNVDEGGTSSGGTNDSGSEGGTTGPAPIGLQVAATTGATCATVQYASQRKVTYCWGAQGSLGAKAGEPNVDGFYRPRLAVSDTTHLTFSILTGSGTGGWFVGRGTDGQTTATYAWGSNESGQCATGSGASPVLPSAMKLGGNLLAFDTIYAAPQHGCMVQNQKFYCWGNNTNCEIRSGPTTTCNTVDQPVLTDKNAYTAEDESAHPSGSNGPVLRMAGGLDHSCREARSSETGIDAMDDISCWGNNAYGQADSTSSSPTIDTPTVPSSLKVRRASAELAAGDNHTCAITDVTKIACWGKNDAGQSNPANPSLKVKPTEVGSVAGALSMVRAAGDLSCVVAKPIGQPSRAFCWGNGPKGRAAGDEGSAVGKVAGIQDITAFAIGSAHACAVARKEGATDKDFPRVYCWGTNDVKRVDPHSQAGATIAQPIEITFPPEPTN